MALRSNEIRLRDPFVLPCEEQSCYYLYGTTDPDCWGPRGIGFDAYRGHDLEHWEGPIAVFRPPEAFWANQHFWAPEVHRYRGRYYMFASFKAPGRDRGTQVLVADSPEGPFRPHSPSPLTPRGWESLDGTLYLDGKGKPWLVFCHEWTQIEDGAVVAQRLTEDLGSAEGEALTLFRASEAPWSVGFPEAPKRRVTDGPWLHRHSGGGLLMLWSSMGAEGYAMGVAVSASAEVTGPWEQRSEPLFARDGGHGMLFRLFGGDLMLALHRPNRTPFERPRFFPIREMADGSLDITALEETG